MFQIAFESLSLSWVGKVDGNDNFPWAIGACRPGLAPIVFIDASFQVGRDTNVTLIGMGQRADEVDVYESSSPWLSDGGRA